MDIQNSILVSVIVLSYNHYNYIKEAIISVINQETDYNYEIVIADDGSTDGTRDVLYQLKEEYPDKIVIVEQKQNVGTTKNLCDALDRARGSYISLLDGDDYWCNMKGIDILANWLLNHQEYIGVCLSYAIQRGNNIQHNCISKKLLNEDFTITQYLDGHGFPAHSTLFKNIFKNDKKTEMFQHIQNSKLIEDISLPMLLLNIGKFYVLPGDLAVYRIRKNENNYNSIKSSIESYQEHIANLVANDNYFNSKYDLSKMISMKTTIMILKAILSKRPKLIKEIIHILPSKYRMKCILYFPKDIYVLLRYKVRGYF